MSHLIGFYLWFRLMFAITLCGRQGWDNPILCYSQWKEVWGRWVIPHRWHLAQWECGWPARVAFPTPITFPPVGAHSPLPKPSGPTVFPNLEFFGFLKSGKYIILYRNAPNTCASIHIDLLPSTPLRRVCIFSDWLLSLSTAPLRFFHVSSWMGSSSLLSGA